jgi:hypothetical protein
MNVVNFKTLERREGYEAYGEGEDFFFGNPYDKNSDEGKEWEIGYIMAEEEDK